MKKVISGILVLIMGFAFFNIGAIANNFIKENSYSNEVMDSEYIEHVNPNSKQTKKRALTEATSDEISAVYTVTFDCNGGKYDGSATFQEKVFAGNHLIKPDSSKLERIYYNFAGWFTDKNVYWDFDADIVNEDIILKAKWHCDKSHDINYYGTETYFTDKYPLTSNWKCQTRKSTADITGYIPIDMQGSDFPEDDVLEALGETGIDSSYGGCGPIAMMGILDYFARYLGYTSITMTRQTKRTE